MLQKIFNVMAIILLGLLLVAATTSQPRYQISATNHLWCWVLNKDTGEVKVLHINDTETDHRDHLKEIIVIDTIKLQ